MWRNCEYKMQQNNTVVVQQPTVATTTMVTTVSQLPIINIYAVTTPPVHLTMQPLCYRCLTSQCLTVAVYVTLRVSLVWNIRLGPWRYSWLCYSASCCGPLVCALWLLFHAVSMAQKMLTTAAPTATTILEQRSVCNSNQATVIVCTAITVTTLWF